MMTEKSTYLGTSRPYASDFSAYPSPYNPSLQILLRMRLISLIRQLDLGGDGGIGEEFFFHSALLSCSLSLCVVLLFIFLSGPKI